MCVCVSESRKGGVRSVSCYINAYRIIGTLHSYLIHPTYRIIRWASRAAWLPGLLTEVSSSEHGRPRMRCARPRQMARKQHTEASCKGDSTRVWCAHVVIALTLLACLKPHLGHRPRPLHSRCVCVCFPEKNGHPPNW